MSQRQLRTIGLIVIVVGAWLVLAPRLGSPIHLGWVPVSVVGWIALAAGWAILLRALKMGRGDDSGDA